jgi:uncharacterized protein Smg (DUF494 family)
MKHSVTELVDEILRLIQDEPDRPVSENKLRSWLVGRGYAKRDIDAAIKLVGPRVTAIRRGAVDRQPGSMRSLSLYEQFKMRPEARDALIRLDLSGLIGTYERELILEHLGHFEGEVGLEELDYLLSWLVCGGRDVEFQQTVANVLEGRGDTFH